VRRSRLGSGCVRGFWQGPPGSRPRPGLYYDALRAERLWSPRGDGNKAPGEAASPGCGCRVGPMTILQHLALSFLLAQFIVQPDYGSAGTLLVLVAGILPDVDGLSILGGWNAQRTYRGAAGHGLPVAVAAPALLALLAARLFGVGAFAPLWLWLQLSMLAHLATDLLLGRWPLQLLWPFSTQRWGFGLGPRADPVPAAVLHPAALAALCWPEWGPAAAGVGVGGLTLYCAWRAARPRPPSMRQPEGGPRLWAGCDFVTWLRLLARNRFAVHPSRWRAAATITLVSLVNTVLRLLKSARYGRRVRRARLPEAPVFILGHWRTGTTLLHELLALDEHHACPTTYQCLAPHHFLMTEGWLPRLLWFLVPALRPMDNMAAGWGRPQEDEFALCLTGQPSPYLAIAFPNRPPPDPEALDLEGMAPRALASWKQAFLHLLRQFVIQSPGKRLVLKSPPHSCRIKVLLELFPDARFVHIVRDPHVVFPSTVKLWKALYQAHGLQRPTFAGLEDYVFRTFTHLYERLEATRGLVPSSRFHELRYEDLVRDPVGQMRALYAHLDLGDFDAVLPRLQKYLAGVAGYRTNRYEQPPEVRAGAT
jgi:membrane-bound metal-dependent hydrolase YbcI (DUF457 family)